MALDEEEANLIQIALDLQYRQRQHLATEVASSKWVFSCSIRLGPKTRIKDLDHVNDLNHVISSILYRVIL